MKRMMDEHAGEKGQEKYFIPHYNEKTGQFLFYEERIGVIEDELSYCGYFSIITSEQGMHRKNCSVGTKATSGISACVHMEEKVPKARYLSNLWL